MPKFEITATMQFTVAARTQPDAAMKIAQSTYFLTKPTEERPAELQKHSKGVQLRGIEFAQKELDDVNGKVLAEVAKAVAKFPTWPTDPLHAIAVLGEEFGELTKSVLQRTYEPHKGVTLEDIADEAIQTAAMALRFAASLSTYQYQRGPQHVQGANADDFAR